MEPVLVVKDLVTKLTIHEHAYNVVDHLSFELLPGKTLAIVGESGCGKTMAALSLMRILPDPSLFQSFGEVLYKDQNLLDLSEKEMRKLRGSRIAMIFQDPTSSLNPVYTVGQQLLEVVEFHLNLFGAEAHRRVLQALEEVGIVDPALRMHDYPHQLSGGMKQRVMIAMALLCEPDILIADEPTTALDVTIQAQILELMRTLQKQRGMALLLITHDMGIVAEMADDVIVMYASQMVEKGEVTQIFDHMKHPYTIGLFQSRPSLTTVRGQLKAIKGSVPPLTHYPTGCRFHPRCPFVMPKCKHADVPNFQIELIPEHTCKCLLYDGTLESTEKKLETKK